MKLYFTCLLIISAKLTFCQSKQLTANQIDSVAMQIDSIKNPYSVVEDGYMTRVHKGILNKIFGKHSTGGYETYYYSDRNTRQLFKVANSSTLDEHISSIYYYLNDSLILVTRSRTKKRSDKKISEGRFYYQQGNLIAQTGNDLETRLQYVLPAARNYLKRWKENFSSKKNSDGF